MKKTILFPSDFPTVPPEVKIGKFYVKETIIQEDQFVPHFSLIYNFPML